MAQYSNVYKAGRAWNGAHRDAGTIVHLVEGENPNGSWFTKSLCGTEPGRRSYGWSPTSKEVNCKKCLDKRAKLDTQPPVRTDLPGDPPTGKKQEPDVF